MHQISIPLNLFEKQLKEVERLQGLLFMLRDEYRKETNEFRKQSLKITLSKKYKELKPVKEKILAYWDYVQLRGINCQKAIFNNKTFIKEVAQFLNITTKEVRLKKRRITKFGFASISGKKFIFKSKDSVWESFGLNIAKRKYKNGKRVTHKKMGVYEILGSKKKNLKIEYIDKKTKVKKTKIIQKEYFKKREIKIIKFTVDESEFRSKQALRSAAALAIYKHSIDREISRHQDELRKTEDNIIDLTCEYIARAVGYLSAASGWKIRESLSDCGFINVIKNRRVVKENIGFEEASDSFKLQQGVQDDGWAYYWSAKNRTVYAVKCYTIQLNGYTPIIYPHKRKKRSKGVFVPHYEKELQSLEGIHIKKIWQEYEHLFSGKTSDFLFDLLDSNGIFYYKDWVEANLKKSVAIQDEDLLVDKQISL